MKSKIEMRNEINEWIANGGKVSVHKGRPNPRVLSAFCKLAPGSNGCRVNGLRLGSKEGRVK